MIAAKNRQQVAGGFTSDGEFTMNTFYAGDEVCEIGKKERLIVKKRQANLLFCEKQSDGTKVQDHFSRFEHYDPVKHQ